LFEHQEETKRIGLNTCNFSNVFDKELKIHRINKESKNATGRIWKILAFPETSLKLPTFSKSSSAFEEKNYISPRRITLYVSPLSVGLTTP